VRSRAGDAAYDLSALNDVVIASGERTVVGTGVAVAIPDGWCGLIVPRSGLAAREGVVPVLGLIDPNYRGELRITLGNQGADDYSVTVGDRIAQLLLVPFGSPEIALVAQLPDGPDDRGAGGFGSSGR
jgi:dUTP pyrophosphatase